VKIYPCLSPNIDHGVFAMKEEIRNCGLALGAEAVGFASIGDYLPARCPDPNTIFPGVESITLLGYGEVHGAIGYLRKFLAASPEDRKKLLMDPQFLSLCEASLIGFQYNCFRCIAPCPACL
jgi:hypothetical protein